METQQESLVNKPKDILPYPENQLEVSFVIPIRGELGNGNFFNQLKNFSRQDTDPRKFEVLYVVNNTHGDKSDNNIFFRENQRLLEIIEYVSHQFTDPPDGLEPWQEDIVENARRQGVKIRALDLSTEGLEERNIEWARKLGMDVAVSRFVKTDIGPHGAIVLTDADVRINKSTTQKIIEQLVQIDDQTKLFLPYDLLPGEGGERVYQSTAEERFQHNNIRMQKMFAKQWQSNFYAVKAGAIFKDLEHTSETELVLRRDLYQPVWGTSLQSEGVRIAHLDRTKEAEGGGFFGTARMETIDTKSPDETYTHPVVGWLLDLYQSLPIEQKNQIIGKVCRLINTNFPGENAKELISDIFSDHSLWTSQARDKLKTATRLDPRQYVNDSLTTISSLLDPAEKQILMDLVAEERHRERIRHGVIQQQLQRLVTQTTYNPNLSAEDISDTHSTSQFEFFLKENPWITSAIKQATTSTSNPETAISQLREQYPEFLKDFDDTKFSAPNATILGICRYLETTQNQPDSIFGSPQESPNPDQINQLINLYGSFESKDQALLLSRKTVEEFSSPDNSPILQSALTILSLNPSLFNEEEGENLIAGKVVRAQAAIANGIFYGKTMEQQTTLLKNHAAQLAPVLHTIFTQDTSDYRAADQQSWENIRHSALEILLSVTRLKDFPDAPRRTLVWNILQTNGLVVDLLQLATRDLSAMDSQTSFYGVTVLNKALRVNAQASEIVAQFIGGGFEQDDPNVLMYRKKIAEVLSSTETNPLDFIFNLHPEQYIDFLERDSAEQVRTNFIIILHFLTQSETSRPVVAQILESPGIRQSLKDFLFPPSDINQSSISITETRSKKLLRDIISQVSPNLYSQLYGDQKQRYSA